MKQTAFWRGKNGEYIPCLKYSAPIIRLLWVHRDQSMKTEKPTRCNNYMFIINFCLNMLRASLCPSSGEQRPSYCIWCIVLVVLDVVDSGCGGCVVGCEQCEVSYSTHVQQKTSQCSHPTWQRPTTATNHIQQNQTNTHQMHQQGLCSPEDEHNDARNMFRQKLIINI